MKKTVTRGDVTITVILNDAGDVNLYKKMSVDYPGIDDKLREIYPAGGKENDKIGTINDQFDFIASSRAFDEAYYRRKLGDRIRSIREQSGMTQSDLSEKTGLKRENISRIEAGKYSTGQDILSKIAQALGKKLDIV